MLSVMQTKTLHKHVLAALEELKALDLISLDVKKMTTVTDVMVICSGRSSRHVKSMAENVVMRMKERGIPVLGMQGEESADWVLVDLGAVVVHVMLPETRAFYDLEKLWSKALTLRPTTSASSKAANKPDS